MEVYLGDWVEGTTHNHIGRVYAKHTDFEDTDESNRWFKGQAVPLFDSDKEKPWYSVLIMDGGAVVIPERCIVARPDLPGTDLNNPYDSFYFRDH